MKFKFLSLLFILTLILPLASCNNDDEPEINLPTQRTILIYMAANNSLGSTGYDRRDLEEISVAARAGAIGNNNRLIVFLAPTDGTKTLYEVDNAGNLNLLKTYDTDQYVVEADFMLQVFKDTKSLAPALDYGLIMWSHALGWTQNGMEDDGPSLSLKTWGEDRGKSMNITTLKRVLEASPWSWVYFDCCFMGSVEVAYELAPVLDVMVASATEVPLDGMPYDQNLPLLFAETPDLIGAAENTFNYYNELSGSARTCSISVLDLTKMDMLAHRTLDIYDASQKVSPSDFTNLPLEVGNTPRFYDFGVYVKGLCEVNDISENTLLHWQNAMNDVVVYHAATPKLWNTIVLTDFTGLSTFIPRNEGETTLRNYDSLAWYKQVAWRLYNKNWF